MGFFCRAPLLDIKCAKGDWPEIQEHIEDESYNQINLVNKEIDVECPIWGGMTPLMISAKFERLLKSQKCFGFSLIHEKLTRAYVKFVVFEPLLNQCGCDVASIYSITAFEVAGS